MSPRLYCIVSFPCQVSDNYKLMVLLPKLRMYNGKDISTTANHLRFVYTENLMTRVGNRSPISPYVMI